MNREQAIYERLRKTWLPLKNEHNSEGENGRADNTTASEFRSYRMRHNTPNRLSYFDSIGRNTPLRGYNEVAR